MTGNLQNVAGVSKSLMMYGTEGAGGLASSTNQLVNRLENFLTCITHGIIIVLFIDMLLPNKTFDVKNWYSTTLYIKVGVWGQFLQFFSK